MTVSNKGELANRNAAYKTIALELQVTICQWKYTGVMKSIEGKVKLNSQTYFCRQLVINLLSVLF